MSIESVTYFSKLDNDLVDAGLLHNTYPVDTIDDLAFELQSTANIGFNLTLFPKNYSPQTNIGDLVLRHHENRTGFLRSNTYSVCSDAEPLLIESLLNAEDEDKFSPIIITSSGDPIAIVKSEGEKTLYGLADMPHLGIYTMVFSSCEQIAQTIKTLPKKPAAYAIDCASMADNSNSALRISTLGVPSQYRIELKDDAKTKKVPNSVSHDEVLAKATDLLNTAKQIKINDYGALVAA